MSDDAYAAAAGGGKSGSGGGKHRGPRFTWNPQYEATFFRSLCDSVHMGLREGSTFKPEAWDRAIKALIDRHNAYANKGHLINKSDNARKKYRLWRGLREDPAFLYNPQTRMVTASEEAWSNHIKKEPHARPLKGRPFEHEEYFEILFPDVIGSGGAPKRLTKPRRKDTEDLGGPEEQDAPGTAIMNMSLMSSTNYVNPVQTHIPQPIPTPPVQVVPMPTMSPATQQLAVQPQTVMPPPPQPTPRSSVSSASALTPPEETALHTRKRSQAAPADGTASHADKRRRTTVPSYLDLSQQQHQQQQQQPHHQQQHHQQHHHQQHQPQQAQQQQQQQQPPQAQPPIPTPTSMSPRTNGTAATHAAAPQPVAPSHAPPAPATSAATALPHDPSAVAAGLAEAILRAGGGAKLLRPAWQEQAMDIFFRDFCDEDVDLQLKIAEKVLTDENKAMVFVKMPDLLRKHWVKRLRELHNRIV